MPRGHRRGRLHHGGSLARCGRQGPGPLPGVLPGRDRARRRDAPSEDDGCARRAKQRGLPFWFLPVLDHQDDLGAVALGQGRAGHVRVPPHLRRSAQPGRNLGSEPRVSLSDPLPPAERQLGGQRHLPGRRVRPDEADGRAGVGQHDHRRRALGVDRSLQQEPRAQRHPGHRGR